MQDYATIVYVLNRFKDANVEHQNILNVMQNLNGTINLSLKNEEIIEMTKRYLQINKF